MGAPRSRRTRRRRRCALPRPSRRSAAATDHRGVRAAAGIPALLGIRRAQDSRLPAGRQCVPASGRQSTGHRDRRCPRPSSLTSARPRTGPHVPVGVLMRTEGRDGAFGLTASAWPSKWEASSSGTLSGRTALGTAICSLWLLTSASVLPCQRLCLGRRNCSVRHGREKVYGRVQDSTGAREVRISWRIPGEIRRPVTSLQAGYGREWSAGPPASLSHAIHTGIV